MIAPEYDQSGVAHSLSLNNPLRLRKVTERRFALRGTPTDCVIMGARHLLGKRPDLVLSGVNRGSNVGEDVIYLGTVAGAVEGTMLGIPSLALSQAFRSVSGGKPHFDLLRSAFAAASSSRPGSSPPAPPSIDQTIAAGTTSRPPPDSSAARFKG